MKCPECGEEIDEVEERGNYVVGYYAVWREIEPCLFEFVESVAESVMDSQTDCFVCPKCEASLKWRVEDEKVVIER